MALTCCVIDVETPAFNGTERVTYIAATEVAWDYIPSGINRCTGEEFDEEMVGSPAFHCVLSAILMTSADGRLLQGKASKRERGRSWLVATGMQHP